MYSVWRHLRSLTLKSNKTSTVKSLSSKHNYIMQINITSYTDVQLVSTASPIKLFDFACSALCEHFRACFQVCTKNIKTAAFLVFHHRNLNLIQPEKQQGYSLKPGLKGKPKTIRASSSVVRYCSYFASVGKCGFLTVSVWPSLSAAHQAKSGKSSRWFWKVPQGHLHILYMKLLKPVGLRRRGLFWNDIAHLFCLCSCLANARWASANQL